jgi:hypothetical protein
MLVGENRVGHMGHQHCLCETLHVRHVIAHARWSLLISSVRCHTVRVSTAYAEASARGTKSMSLQHDVRL